MYQEVMIGALSGSALTMITQYFLFRYRISQSAKRFGRDLSNLRRHLEASLNSLDFDVSKPRYFFSARLRYCKFADGVEAFRDLEWLKKRKDAARILPILVALRNYNIFMEEIAVRADALTEPQMVEAIAEAKININILRKCLGELSDNWIPDDTLFQRGDV